MGNEAAMTVAVDAAGILATFPVCRWSTVILRPSLDSWEHIHTRIHTAVSPPLFANS